jgi:predicted nucleic acid-binding protein
MSLTQPLPDTHLVLDTDIFTHLRKKHGYAMREVKSYFSRVKQLPALSAMTLFEALWGIDKEVKKGELTVESGLSYQRRIDELCQAHKVLPINADAAKIAAHIYGHLSQSDRNKHWRDLFIAATALAHGYGVVSHNRKDFALLAQHLPPSHSVLRLAVWKP